MDGSDPLTKLPGSDLLSQGIAPQVPSALVSFTSVFGMGTGGSSPLSPPDKPVSCLALQALHSEHASSIHIQVLGLLVPVG